MRGTPDELASNVFISYMENKIFGNVLGNLDVTMY